MKKYIIYSFGVLFFLSFFTRVSAQEMSMDQKTAFLDSISNNPSGMIYFFDKKQVSERDMYEKALNGELSNYSGEMYTKSKDAILKFGERYRHGVMFWETNSKRDEKEE